MQRAVGPLGEHLKSLRQPEPPHMCFVVGLQGEFRGAIAAEQRELKPRGGAVRQGKARIERVLTSMGLGLVSPY
jgi:hypothetical protein